AGRTQDRRARHAACWSIGALGIIGWLIAAHEPFPGFAPAVQIADVAPERAVQTAAVAPAPSNIAPTSTIAARPVATPSAASPVARVATVHPASRHVDTASQAQRVAAAAPHRPDDRRTTTARVHAPSAPRFAARPAVTQHASRTPTSDRVGSPVHPGAPLDSLDDPLTLIAMANALHADRPAPAAEAPGAGFDWTAQLSHRRLTDAPGTLTR
ncbi:hypothetical protein, partial [Burkholderia territorii]